MTETSSDNGKTIGIIAHLWLIGWVIALVMHNGNKTEHGAFYVRQTLGIMILWIVVWVINFALTIMDVPFVGYILSIGLFILWLLSFIGSFSGEKKLLPALGAQFQDWFKGVG